MDLKDKLKKCCKWTTIGAVLVTGIIVSPNAMAQEKNKPNILVIFGDDIGISNISAYGKGVVGYQTPNIDRLAKEGAMFTDYYAENSCTAGQLNVYYWTKLLPYRSVKSRTSWN